MSKHVYCILAVVLLFSGNCFALSKKAHDLRLTKKIAENERLIDTKTECLALKYRQLAAVKTTASADRTFENSNPSRSDDFDQNHAIHTNQRLNNLEISTIKNEIGQLKHDIKFLQAQNKKLKKNLKRS